MQSWPVQDAKARFSEFLETCLAEGPQLVPKRGSAGSRAGARGRMASPAGSGPAVVEAVAAGQRSAGRAGPAPARQGPPPGTGRLGLSRICLLDTDVVFKLRRPRPHGAVLAWLERVPQAYNVLPMDARAFRMWAQPMRRKSDTAYEDAMIAATGKVHGLTVVTCNIADFKTFGVPLLDPFKTR